MSVKVEGEVTAKDMTAGERDLLREMRAAVQVALDAGTNPNHVISIIAALFVKTALSVGMPHARLDDLVEGLKLTIKFERDDLERRAAVAS